MFAMAPETRRLLELFRDAEYGAEFSYAEILNETGCDLAGGHRQRVYTVNDHLERDHLRSLVNIRGVGYKIAHPREHTDSMRARKQRAGRQIVKAKRTGQATDLSALTEIETREWSDVTTWISRAEQMFAHHERRLERIERQLGLSEQESVDGTAEEVPES